MKDRYVISSDKDLLDITVIHHFLCYHSYWGKGRSREIVQKSVDNSALCFGVYKKNEYGQITEQIGFARVISDLTTFAYIADVFILPDYRGMGLSKKLLTTIVEHPELANVNRMMLATKDAHKLYEKFGFMKIHDTDLFMELKKEQSYR